LLHVITNVRGFMYYSEEREKGALRPINANRLYTDDTIVKGELSIK